MINGLSNFLFFNDFKTDSESEKIKNLSFFDTQHYGSTSKVVTQHKYLTTLFQDMKVYLGLQHLQQ